VEPEKPVVIVVYGEGKTEVRPADSPAPPTKGVVSILTHNLCGKPSRLRVLSKHYAHLQGKTRASKVWFAKRQDKLSRRDGIVFVLDSEGDLNGRIKELNDGRNRGFPETPMAIGVAHPCIEAWLLADADAIRRGMKLSTTPTVPTEPEKLPAPCKNPRDNPKTALRAAAGCTNKQELSADEKDRIATAINDFDILCNRCPAGFAPFATEVRTRIRPLFDGG
jgi:hypothetical protein